MPTKSETATMAKPSAALVARRPRKARRGSRGSDLRSYIAATLSVSGVGGKLATRRHVVPDAARPGAETHQARRGHTLDAEVPAGRHAGAQQALARLRAGVVGVGPGLGSGVEGLRGKAVEGERPNRGRRQPLRERGPGGAAVVGHQDR